MGNLPVGGSQPAAEGTLAEGGKPVVRGRLAVGDTQAVVGRPPVAEGILPLRDTEVQKLQARISSKVACE